MTAKQEKEGERKPDGTKSDKPLKFKKETIKDLAPSSREENVRGGAARPSEPGPGENDIC